jgi:nicotinate-nucleotide adenylyltransferase
VTATTTDRLGVLGGMFDPIHNGHVAAGVAAQLALGLDEIRLVPSRQPPHRPAQPVASADDRLAMARLAAGSQKTWTVSEVEITRAGTSYTFDTLTDLVKMKQVPFRLFFILGVDAFAEIDTWSRFPQVLDLANFVVIARPGFTLADAGNKLPSLAARMTTPERFLAEAREGTAIILVEATTPPVSSTEIRRRISSGASIADLVPSGVDHYIRDHRLYLAPANGAGR